MNDSYRNPFSGIDAAKLDPEQIVEYWCNPFIYDLFLSVRQEDIYEDENNIVFMGGRSSGKSMFLRYWSYPVQSIIARKNGRKILDAVIENGGIGFYHRIDIARLNAFNGFDLSEDHWNSTFSHFFELVVGRQYIEFLKLVEREEGIPNATTAKILEAISGMLSERQPVSFDLLLKIFDERVKQVEDYLRDVPFYKKPFVPTCGFISGSLSFGIPRLLTEIFPQFNNLNYLILLDE